MGDCHLVANGSPALSILLTGQVPKKQGRKHQGNRESFHRASYFLDRSKRITIGTAHDEFNSGQFFSEPRRERLQHRPLASPVAKRYRGYLISLVLQGIVMPDLSSNQHIAPTLHGVMRMKR